MVKHYRPDLQRSTNQINIYNKKGFAILQGLFLWSDFVSLKRKGQNLWACCPFHNEKTPSFSVNPTKGFYKCFGCGKSGDSITFVMEMEKVGYPEALRYLAKKYAIESDYYLNHIEADRDLGALYVKTGRFAEAIPAYSKVIDNIQEENVRDWIIYYTRGIVFDQEKRWAEAEMDFKKALEIRPEQPMVLNYLAYSCLFNSKKCLHSLSVIVFLIIILMEELVQFINYSRTK